MHLFVDDDLGDLRRRECAVDVAGGIGVPGHDIDPLAPEFLHDGLNAASLHSDARPNRIDIAVSRRDRDLRAPPGLSSGRLDGHDLLVHLRHFLLEEFRQQFGCRSRQHDLGALAHAIHIEHVGPDAVAGPVPLARNLLLRGKNRLGPAQIDNQGSLLEATNNPVDHLALAVRILIVGMIALGVPDALDDDLLRRLSKDPPKTCGVHLDTDLIADLGLRIVIRNGHRILDLALAIGHHLDNFHKLEEFDLSELVVITRLDFLVGSVAFVCSLLHGRF